MPTVFESISDGFYTAFFEPDPDVRKEKIEVWIKESTPIIQSAVENDLRIYLEEILKDTWTEKGWKTRTQKFYNPSFIDNHKLLLDIQIKSFSSNKTNLIVDRLTPEVRAKTNAAVDSAKWAIAKLEPPPAVTLREVDLHGNTVNEAIPIVEKFLTECYRDNVRRVRIIHGKGIFVLQKAIREYLGMHKFVKPESISSADKDHGGEGATEANLIDFSVDKLN